MVHAPPLPQQWGAIKEKCYCELRLDIGAWNTYLIQVLERTEPQNSNKNSEEAL